MELYTMGQGAVLFERYGHAALCVVYAQPRSDRTVCYNYGTTDFGSPPAELGWEFLRGTSQFWVSTSPREEMLALYRRSDRSIYRQVLPLSDAQARELADRLAHDALPENRYYTYHHFDDNCTTRVRDHIDAVTGGALSRGADQHVPTTFRELGRQGIAEIDVAILAGNLLFGRRLDDQPTVYEAMFLPDYLRAAVTERLGAEPELVYERRGPPFPQAGGYGSQWVIAFAIVLALPVWLAWWRGRFERMAFAISGGLLSVLALVVWVVALASTIRELRYNEALLVFWPTDVLLAVFDAPRRRTYARIRLIWLLLMSAGLALGLFVQPLQAHLLIPVLVCLPVLVPRPKKSTAAAAS